MRTFSRRSMLSAMAALACVPGLPAIEPFARSGPPRLRLSLAAYSFRQFFRDGGSRASGAERGSPVIDLKEFIDFCAEHGCEGAELTSYYFPADPSEDFLLDVRRHAFLRGVSVSGTAVGNNFTLPSGPRRQEEIASVKRWIERARILGAPHIRVFAGNLEGQEPAVARQLCVEALEECADAAGRAGIFLGLENHGGIVSSADDLISIVRAVQSPWFGINLDTGNFHTADPYGDLARCAPYAVNVQVKVEVRREGGADEPTDYPRLVGILRDAGYQGWVALEYEARENPFQAVPRHLKALGSVIQKVA